MKAVTIASVIVGVLAFLAVGLFIAQGPQPEIIVPAEKLTAIGPLEISNTLLTSWIVMVLIIAIAWLCTRSMTLIPGGAQNFLEAVISFLVGQVEEIAGEKNGRKFFMVIATIFLWVIFNNWFGLFPFFNAIGKTEDVNHHILETIAEQAHDGTPFEKRDKFGAWFMENTGGITMAKPRAKAVEFEVQAGDTAEVAGDRYVVFLAEKFTDFRAHAEDEEAAPTKEAVEGAMAALNADPKAPKVHIAAEGGHGEAAEGHEPVPSATLGAIESVEFPGRKLGLVIPFFRGTFSDVNNTLAMGIVSFFVVEFWGFQALGLAYLGKFFVAPWKSPIMTFVGFLELLSELIRIISFCFRLFGNIFAGEVLVLMLTFLMPFLFVDVIYGLELFVGFIQAAVFALLTLVFAIGAVEHHGDDDHHEEHGAEHPTGAVQAH
ncbi:MAG: F0F1 ATP synthase subunit A [Dehalococcoidia bacterium]|nr:F0F1 ATP synthase subunit A [Dehalococcoidia bacterium]